MMFHWEAFGENPVLVAVMAAVVLTTVITAVFADRAGRELSSWMRVRTVMWGLVAFLEADAVLIFLCGIGVIQ